MSPGLSLPGWGITWAVTGGRRSAGRPSFTGSTPKAITIAGESRLGAFDIEGRQVAGAKAFAHLQDMYTELVSGGVAEFCDIWVTPSSIEIDGVTHGLFYEQSDEEPEGGQERGEWVMLEPRDSMPHPPGGSGNYSTCDRLTVGGRHAHPDISSVDLDHRHPPPELADPRVADPGVGQAEAAEVVEISEAGQAGVGDVCPGEVEGLEPGEAGDGGEPGVIEPGAPEAEDLEARQARQPGEAGVGDARAGQAQRTEPRQGVEVGEPRVADLGPVQGQAAQVLGQVQEPGEIGVGDGRVGEVDGDVQAAPPGRLGPDRPAEVADPGGASGRLGAGVWGAGRREGHRREGGRGRQADAAREAA
jgi:hypothetical protein